MGKNTKEILSTLCLASTGGGCDSKLKTRVTAKKTAVRQYVLYVIELLKKYVSIICDILKHLEIRDRHRSLTRCRGKQLAALMELGTKDFSSSRINFIKGTANSYSLKHLQRVPPLSCDQR